MLGSGTSFGVPVIGCDCRVCTSADPRDRRTRVAAVVESDAGARVLIDTPPELRLQLLAAGIRTLEAVLYTHGHADHVHGLDDLRAISHRRGRLPVYGPARMVQRLRRQFPYVFAEAGELAPGSSRPELFTAALEPNRPTEIAGVPVLPLELDHGGTPVYGYRFGHLAYLTDVKRVPPAALQQLKGTRVLVVNALFERPHPTHLSIPEALDLIATLEVERAYLTHLTHAFRHAELAARLPPGVEPAYDGLVIPFDASGAGR